MLTRGKLASHKAGQRQAIGNPGGSAADIPTGNLTARRDASMDIVSALGVPSVLFVGGNSGVGLARILQNFCGFDIRPAG